MDKVNVNVKFDELPNVICKECGSYHFKEVYMIKRVSGIISGSGKTEIMPYPVLVCINCNAQLEDYEHTDAKKEEVKPSMIITP